MLCGVVGCRVARVESRVGDDFIHDGDVTKIRVSLTSWTEIGRRHTSTRDPKSPQLGILVSPWRPWHYDSLSKGLHQASLRCKFL